jgi:hypothetical protein
VAESLVPTLRKNIDLVPLQTFWGSNAYVNPSCNSSGDLISDRPDLGRKIGLVEGSELLKYLLLKLGVLERNKSLSLLL